GAWMTTKPLPALRSLLLTCVEQNTCQSHQIKNIGQTCYPSGPRWGRDEALQDARLINGRKGGYCVRHCTLRQGRPCGYHYLPSAGAHECHQWPDARGVERSLVALPR